jgi:hypothetical protein
MSDEWVEWLKTNAQPYKIQVSNALIQVFLNKLDSMGNDFIDWGFGTGYLTIALANRENKVQGLEIRPELLEWAEETAGAEFLSSKGALSFTLNQDDLKPADIVFSDGLFEHYPDDKIIDIIKEQMAFAKKYVVFNLPSKFYPPNWNQFGDERLLTLKEWEDILKPFKTELIELYYYGANDFFLMGVIKTWKKAKKTES